MKRCSASVVFIAAFSLTMSLAVPELSRGSGTNSAEIVDPDTTGEVKTIKDGRLTDTENTIKGGGLPPGCVCHSKVPEFVTMHNQFSVEDCRKCHGEDEKLMGKTGGEMTEERKAALRERRRKESICQVCHRGDEIVVTGKSEISGHLFCPKGQEMYSREEATEKEGERFCPNHDVELIDIDEIAVKSAREPKNEYCIACHPIDEELRKRHKKAEATVEDTSQENCLICHESHSKCGGCHF